MANPTYSLANDLLAWKTTTSDSVFLWNIRYRITLVISAGDIDSVMRTNRRDSLEKHIVSPISNELRFRYLSIGPHEQLAPNMEKVLQMSINSIEDKISTATSYNTPKPTKSSKKTWRQKQLHSPSEALHIICQAVAKEEAALTIDHFRLHRTCWELLREINKENAKDMVHMYGPNYLRMKESNLIVVVGWILLEYGCDKRIHARLLKTCAGVFKRMIDRGMGNLEAPRVKRLMKGSFDFDPAVDEGARLLCGSDLEPWELVFGFLLFGQYLGYR